MLVFPGYFFFTKQYYMVAIATEDPQRQHTDAIFANWAT